MPCSIRGIRTFAREALRPFILGSSSLGADCFTVGAHCEMAVKQHAVVLFHSGAPLCKGGTAKCLDALSQWGPIVKWPYSIMPWCRFTVGPHCEMAVWRSAVMLFHSGASL